MSSESPHSAKLEHKSSIPCTRDLSHFHAIPSSPFFRKVSPCLVFLELGSFHGNLEPQIREGTLASGGAYIKAKIDAVRKDYPPDSVIVASTGDFFTGPRLAMETEGKPVIEFMNATGFDFLVLGHHDFDKGQAILAQRLKEARFPVIVSNMIYEKPDGHHISLISGHPLSSILPFYVFERNSYKIMVLGLMRPDCANFQLKEFITGLKWTFPKKAIKHVLTTLSTYKTILPDILCIYHKNLEQAKEIVQYTNNLIHKKLNLPLPFIIYVGSDVKDFQTIYKDNYIIAPGTSRGYRLGKITIELDLIHAQSQVAFEKVICKDLTPDSQLEQQIADYKSLFEPPEVLGRAVKLLNRKRDTDASLGILLTEAMRNAAKSEVAFISSGTIKTEIPAGDITVDHLKASVPFPDRVSLLEMPGSLILLVLERGAKLEADSGSGGKLLQVAGIRMSYDVKQPKGKRLVECKINGDALIKDRIYKAAVSTYLVKGGDGFEEFKKGKLIKKIGLLHDIVAGYIKIDLKGIIDIEPDQRITKIS